MKITTSETIVLFEDNGTLIAKAWTNGRNVWECNKLVGAELTSLKGTKAEVLAYCEA